jgi:hypothetical protein
VTKLSGFQHLLEFWKFTKSSISWSKIIFRQTWKVLTYSNVQGESKNATKRDVVLIPLQDVVFEESL